MAKVLILDEDAVIELKDGTKISVTGDEVKVMRHRAEFILFSDRMSMRWDAHNASRKARYQDLHGFVGPEYEDLVRGGLQALVSYEEGEGRMVGLTCLLWKC